MNPKVYSQKLKFFFSLLFCELRSENSGVSELGHATILFRLVLSPKPLPFPSGISIQREWYGELRT